MAVLFSPFGQVRLSAPYFANPCTRGALGCRNSAQPGRRRCADCIRSTIAPAPKSPPPGVAKGSRNNVVRALAILSTATRPQLVRQTGLHDDTVKRVLAQLVTERRVEGTGQTRPAIAPSGRKVYHKVYTIPTTRYDL